MRLKQRLAAVCVGMLGVFVAHGAPAQEVDYGALEQMFGQPVTTSATGSPQLASQAPADMQIITADDIKHSGATTIPDILDFVAGIDVRQNGALSNDVNIRGFSQSFNPRLLVLINGRQVYVEDYGYVAWQALPVQLSEIRQIEIVRGPASALFGFNATSGVINIITYDPLYDETNVASAGIGTDGTYEGSIVATAQEAGKAGMRISLGGLKTNEYSETPARTVGFPDARPLEGSVSLDGRWSPRSGLDVDAEITDSGANSFNPTFYTPGTTFYRTKSYKLGLTDDTALGLFSLQGYVNQNNMSVNNFRVTHYNLINQIGVLQASDLVKFADVHAVRVGLEFRDSRAWGDAYGGTANSKDYAADLMWNWQITPQLSLTNAVRIDHLVFGLVANYVAVNPYTLAEYNRASVTAPSYNSGLVYQPTQADTIRLLAGRGLQAPSLIDEGFQDAGIPLGPFTLLLAGSPYLKASTLDNYEVDYDRQLPALDSAASVAAYYQVDRDFLLSPIDIVPQISGQFLEALSQNYGYATAFGGELGVHGANEAGWRWNASYSLFTVHQRLSLAPPVIPFNFADATPTSAIDVGLGYTLGKFDADVHGKWQSRYADYRPNAQRLFDAIDINNYVSLNARVGYNVTPRLTLAVVGTELTAPRIVETGGLPVDRRALFTATYGF